MKKRQYDLTLIVKGDKTAEEAKNVFEAIKEKLEKIDIQIEKAVEPVLKNLAYEIEKMNQGYYATFIFSKEGFKNSDLEEIFKFNNDIIRYLTVDYSEGVGLRKQKYDRRVKKYQENTLADKKEKVFSEEREKEIDDKIEEKVEEIREEKTEESNDEKINQEKEESTAQKQIDLESLDEKLDELLK